MWTQGEYIFGFPNGEIPYEAQYRRQQEDFYLFISRILTQEQYLKWTGMREISKAVDQVLEEKFVDLK